MTLTDMIEWVLGCGFNVKAAFVALKYRMIALAPEIYDSMPDLGEIEVYLGSKFQSGSRVLKKVF